MPYLNCPHCRLSINAASAKGLFDKCPRCSASYGRTSLLVEAPVPYSKLSDVHDPHSGGIR